MDAYSSSITSLLPRTCNPRVSVGSNSQDIRLAQSVSPQQYMSMENSSAFGAEWIALDHNNIGVDPLKRGFALGEYGLPTSTSLAHFSCEPGFAERAARFSLLGSRSHPPSFTPSDNKCRNPLTGLVDEARSTRIPARVETTSTTVTTSKVAAPNQIGRDQIDGVDGQINGDEARKRPRRSCSPTGSPGQIDESCHTSGLEHVVVSSPTESGTTNGSAGLITSSPRSGCDIAASPLQSGKKRKNISEAGKDSTCPGNKDLKTAGAQAKRSKGCDEKDGQKSKAERCDNSSSGKQTAGKDSKPVEQPKTDYIHVRARRGQATDSHSLAERVRREKISERMKFLQDLVPGCSKVTGKAVMLDEIINYVQSIQRQVEFLSMKLAAVTPHPDFNIDSFLAKQLLKGDSCGVPNMVERPESRVSYSQFPQLQSHQTQQTQSSFVNALDNSYCTESGLRRPISTPLVQPDMYGGNVPQTSSLWEGDLHSVVQMGYASHRIQPAGLGGFQCTLPPGHLKVEL